MMKRIYQNDIKKQSFDAAILTSLEGGKLILSLEKMGQRMTVCNHHGLMTFNHLQDARDFLKKVPHFPSILHPLFGTLEN